MKIILFIPIICTLLFGKLQAQEGISLTKVKEIYTLSEINYTGEKTITLKLNSGLIIKATPVNPPELDKLFYEKSLANGQLQYSNYEQSRKDYFIKKKKKRQKEDKTNTEMLLELAAILLEDEKISVLQYFTLKSAIENRKNTNETELESDFQILINPFYINNKYLSVYQLTIENPTVTPILFGDEINLLFSNTLYSRYSTQDLLDLYKVANIDNFSKISLLQDENLPENLLIPAGVTFSKYICTTPIKYDKGPLALIISSPNSTTKALWNIDISINEIEKTYTYNVFDFYLTSGSGLAYAEMTLEDGVIVNFSNDSEFYLLGNTLYVNEENLKNELNLGALFIYMDNVYYLITKIIPETYLNLDKKSMNVIDLEMEKMEMVKRKLD